MIAAASAIAIAAGPLIGGAVTTFASWRYVFVAEVVVVGVILVLLRKVADQPAAAHGRFDFLGALLSIVGLAAPSSACCARHSGAGQPEAGRPDLPRGLPVVWLVVGAWPSSGCSSCGSATCRRAAAIRWCAPRCSVTTSSSVPFLFFFQFLVQMGVFFVIPLYLSVVLGLSAVQTGARLLPLSLALLVRRSASLGSSRASPHVAWCVPDSSP